MVGKCFLLSSSPRLLADLCVWVHTYTQNNLGSQFSGISLQMLSTMILEIDTLGGQECSDWLGWMVSEPQRSPVPASPALELQGHIPHLAY